MNDAARLTVWSGASGLACIALTALVMTAAFPAASRSAAEKTHDHLDAVPLCTGTTATSQPNFYSEMSQVNAQMHTAMDVAPSGDVDRDFIRMMIPHHQGAVDMALVLLKYGHDTRLKRLAQSIVVEQAQEIAYMRSLLDTPRADAPQADHPPSPQHANP